MIISRRDTIRATLFGAGMMGLRTLATGLPAALLADPRRAFAAMADAGPAGAAQFVIMSTSGSGDPLNCNVPGTYENAGIVHSQDPLMAKTNLTLSGTAHAAAAPWAGLPQAVLDRTAFFHAMTNTPVHPKEPNVLQLMGAINQSEMFPSLIAKLTGGSLGTVQLQPMAVGATSPSETVTFGGAPLATIPPLALKQTLTSGTSPLSALESQRDTALAQIFDAYKNTATPAQRAYVDSLVTSQTQLRVLQQKLMSSLATIKDNSPMSQVIAAIALVQLKVTPVVTMHIPFGGDNHQDAALKNETAQTVSGVATIGALMAQLAAAGLEDNVTFLSLNVFGRTMAAGTENGRQHNSNHQVSIAIGKPFRGGVYGGVTAVGKDFGALPIVSATGVGSAAGDISAVNTLASFGATALAAAGAPSASISAHIPSGKVIAGALA